MEFHSERCFNRDKRLCSSVFPQSQTFLSSMKLMVNDRVLLTHKTPKYLVYIIV